MELTMWLVLVILFAVFEAVSMDLTSIWFAFGAVFGMIAALFTDSMVIQFIVFAVFTTSFIIFLKPISKKYLFKEQVKTNVDKHIGQKCIATTLITTDEGEAKIDGKIWSARCKNDGEQIEVGEKALVLEIQGVKLIVKKL